MKKFERVQQLIARDERHLFTFVSFVLVLAFFLNLSIVRSLAVGISATAFFFLINGTFLGDAFFEEEGQLLRLALGSLLLIVFIGLISWFIMIVYNLDILQSAGALAIVSILSSSLNKLTKGHPKGNETQREINNKSSMSINIAEIIYLLLIAASFFLLFTSRSSEIYTVWQFMHPMFIPLLFLTTFLLVLIIFSPTKTEQKLMLIIIHSVLIHSFFFIVFPAGDIGGQQLMLARTRMVFDNIILNGWPPSPPENILGQIYSWFRPTNFQMGLSVISARMFAIDVFWPHLLLVPILWGAFLPIAVFMITKIFSRSENISVLSSLLISLFPPSIYWGATSVPNSIGYIFFSYSIIFFLKYLFSNDTKTILLLISFSLASLLGHFLTGILSFSLLLLAITFKRYEIERTSSPKVAKASLAVSFIFCVSLLPLALIYVKFFYPFFTYFSLAAFSEFSASEIIWAFAFGEYPTLNFSTAVIHVLGPLLGIAGILYVIFRHRKQASNNEYRITLLFMLTALMMIAIDYRILKFFMTGLPFAAGRLWMFQYLIAIPFMAVVVHDIVTFLYLKASKALSAIHHSVKIVKASLNTKVIRTTITVGMLIMMYVSALVFFSGWITLAVYRAYPHFSPLQITSYELESVKYIDTHTAERYIVIGDMWILFAGHMIVGINNPRAFYFPSTDPDGMTLFIQMKSNPTNETLIEAMEYNNATVAYFIIEKPRLGVYRYNYIVNQAQQNGLQTYEIFYYPEGEEKLRIFYCKKPFINFLEFSDYMITHVMLDGPTSKLLPKALESCFE